MFYFTKVFSLYFNVIPIFYLLLFSNQGFQCNSAVFDKCFLSRMGFFLLFSLNVAWFKKQFQKGFNKEYVFGEECYERFIKIKREWSI